MDTPTLPPHPKKSRRHIFKIVVWILGGAILAWIIVPAIGVYGFTWSGVKTRQLSSWWPLPVSMVGAIPQSFHHYVTLANTMAGYNAYLYSVDSKSFPKPTPESNTKDALTRIIRGRALRVIAKRLGVTVRSTDVDQAFNDQIVQGGNLQSTTDAIQKLYHWTPAEFKKNVVTEAVMRSKVQEKISADKTLTKAAEDQANKVLGLVKASPQSFADLAKSYSDDLYAPQGGDLGFIRRGEQLTEIDDAVFGLKVNDVSSLVRTKYGFHILMLKAIRTTNGTEERQVSEILIAAPTVDQMITDELKKDWVFIALPGWHWDAAKGEAAHG